MTAPGSSFRKRRRGAAVDSVPKAVAAWFGGGRCPVFTVRGHPGNVLVVDWWAAWRDAQGKGVTPPPGFEWLDEPQSDRHRHCFVGAAARAARRAKCVPST